MSQSQIESFGLRRAAAVATGLYCILFAALIAYMGMSVGIDGTMLVAAAVVLGVSAPACYVLLVKQWRELGIEPADGT